MGNTVSNSKIDSDGDPTTLKKAVDQIASQYILKQTFKDLVNLREPDKCSKLVILTANIINEYLDDRQITYLQQQTEMGDEINKKTKESIVYYMNPTESNNIDSVEKSPIIIEPALKKEECVLVYPNIILK